MPYKESERKEKVLVETVSDDDIDTEAFSSKSNKRLNCLELRQSKAWVFAKQYLKVCRPNDRRWEDPNEHSICDD